MGKLKLILILCCLAGPVCLWLGWQEKQEFKAITNEGVTAPAQVIEGHVEKSRRRRGGTSTKYKLTLRWSAQGGNMIAREFSVPSSFYEQHTSGVLPVRYLPADPRKCHIVGLEGNPNVLLYIGIGLTAVGVLFVTGLVLKLRSRKTQTYSAPEFQPPAFQPPRAPPVPPPLPEAVPPPASGGPPPLPPNVPPPGK